MNKRALLAGTIAALTVVGATDLRAQDHQAIPDGAGEGWVQSMHVSIDGQVQLLASAYRMDEATSQQLREHLMAQLADQWHFEQMAQPEIIALAAKAAAAGQNESSPDFQAAIQRMRELENSMPLGEEKVALEVEASLPPEVVAEGRPRLEALRVRREKIAAAQEEDLQERSGRSRTLTAERQARAAQTTESGRPVPAGRPLPQTETPDVAVEVRREVGAGAVRRPTVAAKTPTVVATESGRSKTPPAPPAAITLPNPMPAPPLDQWDKHLDQTAERYGFGDEQRTKSQSILRDIRKRAEQYRLSYADEFDRAGRIEEAKARNERLAELNAPIDALFDELKQRVDNLATAEQRERANTPPPKKG